MRCDDIFSDYSEDHGDPEHGYLLNKTGVEQMTD